MAEGEYNRFYIRALCVRAIEDSAKLEIYRARSSNRPDPASENLIGGSPDAQALLEDLRSHQGRGHGTWPTTAPQLRTQCSTPAMRTSPPRLYGSEPCTVVWKVTLLG